MSGGSSIRSVSARVLVALALSPMAAAGTTGAPLADALAEPIRRARQAAPELGLHIVDLQTGDTVAAHLPDRPLSIASNAKLLTTAAALEFLGPGFFYETPLLLSGEMDGETLVGRMAVVGGGDPSLSGRLHYGDPLAVFRSWAARLRRAGIRRIDGDLVLAAGAFEPLQVHQGWPEDQRWKCYEAPVAALSFNDNCVRIEVLPGSSPGRPVRVVVSPDLGLFTIHNEAVTTSSVRQHRLVIDRTPGTNDLLVGGRVYLRAERSVSRVSVHDPVEYFGAALREALRQEGVTVGGEVVPVRELPPGPWWRLATHRSDLLTSLGVINGVSQNFYAESLLKTLGLELCGEGSWAAGKKVIGEFLDRVGIPRGEYELADGSGLSRENRMSARHLTDLLAYMLDRPAGGELWASLPVSGQEDHYSWRSRLARDPYKDRVFAKTGSLSGVSTLSGYARAVSGRLYAFSVLCNRARSVYDARRAQDRILRALIEHG